MNRVKFERRNGGLARQLPGEDHISALLIIGEPVIEKTFIFDPSELESKGVTITDNPAMFYHVNEFFRINPGAKLYIMSVSEVDGDYMEVKILDNYANGSIRKLGVLDFKTTAGNLESASANLNEVCKELRGLNTPLSAILSVVVKPQEFASLPNIHTFNNENVSILIGQDAGGLGNYLHKSGFSSIGMIGAVLGAWSKAKVNESIGWIEKFDLVSTAYSKKLTDDFDNAKELDVLGFCDGSKLEDYTPGQIQAISDKGYIFGIKETGQTGSYCNDSFTATALDSDYAYMENNTTYDKALRGIAKVLTPKIQSPAYVDPDTGYLDPANVASLEALADDVLDQMKRDGEISGGSVFINPQQAVLRNSKCYVVVNIVPTGTLREFAVQLGLTIKLN